MERAFGRFVADVKVAGSLEFDALDMSGGVADAGLVGSRWGETVAGEEAEPVKPVAAPAAVLLVVVVVVEDETAC